MRLKTIALFFASIVFSTLGKSITLKGVAKSFDSDKIVYFEEHEIDVDEKGFNKRIQTKYLKPNGQLFAKMDSNFSKNKLIPEIEFEDLRFKKKEFLTYSDDKAVFKQKTESQEEVVKEIKSITEAAAGQGFDNFIKFHFDPMQSQEVPLNFGVLSEMTFYSFKAYKKEESGGIVKFGISLTNPFYRLFAKELIVAYDSKTKQLLSYRGLSNILDDQSNRQNVQIDYEVVKP